MTTTQLRKELKRRIDRLGERPLRSIADFAAYLEEASNPVAVEMSRRLEKAEQEVARGLGTPVSKLRRKY